MSEELTTDTLVAGENVQPVNTDAEATTSVAAKSDAAPTPSVEVKDGKMFIDGVRVYSRDDTNRIAANARKESEAKLLSDLEVDSLDKVKSVVSQLRSTEDTGLDVQSLRDAVKKREQTVEELRAELLSVKTDYALRQHIGTLKESMPTAWNQDQRQAVVDLMKARDMLHLDGDSFHIRQGENFITVDGETPDYKTAVEMVGKTLGLPFAKRGVETFESDRAPQDSQAHKGINQDRLKKDAAYRNAYVRIRETQRGISRSDITDGMIRKQMEQSGLR